MKVEELFAEVKARWAREFGQTLNVLVGRGTVDYERLKTEEEDAITECVMNHYRLLKKVSPEVAETFRRHLDIFIIFGGIAKATFPESKPITYPAEAGTIGVEGLIPQAIRYVATASSTYPAYSGYDLNKWTISLTEGTEAYLLGSSTALYKASPTTGQHTYLVVCQDGLIEIGTSPAIIQQKLEFQGQEGRYSPWATHVLVDQTIERNTSIYQYNTRGVLGVSHDLGVRWSVMPKATKVSELRMLGIFFYEFDFMSDLKWIS